MLVTIVLFNLRAGKFVVLPVLPVFNRLSDFCDKALCMFM